MKSYNQIKEHISHLEMFLNYYERNNIEVGNEERLIIFKDILEIQKETLEWVLNEKTKKD
jgi:hypothetical protein